MDIKDAKAFRAGPLSVGRHLVIMIFEMTQRGNGIREIVLDPPTMDRFAAELDLIEDPPVRTGLFMDIPLREGAINSIEDMNGHRTPIEFPPGI